MKADVFRTLAPREGRHILDPDDRFQPLPAEGKRVRISTYWVQLLAEGDVFDAPGDATDQPEPVTKASKAKP